MANIKEAGDVRAIRAPATSLYLNMTAIKKKFLAQELRKKGLSVSEIAKRLNMQKSGTIGKWCRDVLLTPQQIEKLAEKQKSGSYKGRMKFLERVRKKRIEETSKLKKQGKKEVGKINKRDLFIAGISIYKSEGYNHSSNDQVGFVNSDPQMVLLMLKWFREICKVPDKKFSLSVRINKIHKNRVKRVENYWSKITGVPLSQFTKTTLIKTKLKKIYPNHNTHYGNLRVLIHQGTQLRRKINGWVEGLLKMAV